MDCKSFLREYGLIEEGRERLEVVMENGKSSC